MVIEGISASGKSSWCSRHAPSLTVAENGRLQDAPSRSDDPVAAAQFWVERNVERWQAALELERGTSLAVCDTDPLKLHYIWSLVQIGEANERDWRLELSATREAMAQDRIGFADNYYVAELTPHVARERAKADPLRRRRNFDLHVRLQPAVLAWYAALDAALPGRVFFGFPSRLPEPTDRASRYELTAFGRMIDALRSHPGLAT